MAIEDVGGNITINSGNTLTIGTDGIDMSAADANFTMNNAVSMGSAQSWTVAASRTLTSAGVVSGSVKLTKAGSGTLTLSGTNTFTGGVDHDAGTLNVNSSAALGTTAGTFSIASGTTIDNSSGSAITTSNYPMSIAGSFTFTGSDNLNMGTGATALGATSTITTSASEFELGGVVSGSYGLVKAGAGTLTLSGTNTFTGGVTHNAGTLNVDAAAALGTTAGTFTIASGTTVDNTSGSAITTSNYPMSIGGSFTFTGSDNLNMGTGATALGATSTITTSASEFELGGIVSGSYGLVKAGAGTLTLSGTNTFTGGVTHNAGTLNIDAAAALGTTAGTFTIASGTTVDNTSGSAITTSNYPMSIGGSFTFTGSDNLNMGTGATALGATSTITTSASEFELGGVVSGSYGLVKAGAGTLTLSGTNTFTGGVTHNAGTLNIDAAAALGTTAGTFTIASGTTIDNTSGGDITTSNYPIALNGDFTFTGSNNLNLGAGAVTLGADLTITSSTNDLTFGGDVSGAYSVTTTGAGNVYFTGTSNSFTGKTTVGDGSVYFNTVGNVGGGSTSLGAPASVANGTIAIGATTGDGALIFNGSSDQSTDRVIDLAGTTGGATIDAGSSNNLTFTSDFTATGVGSKTLTLKGSTTSNEIQGAIVNNDGSNTTAIDKQGSGTWILSGTNTYTGTTTITAGTLQVGAGGTSGSISSASVVNGGTLEINRSDAMTYSGVVSSTGAVTKKGAGTLTLSGANTYTGTTTITAGAIQLGASGVIADGSNIVMNGGGLITGSGAGYTETVGTLDLEEHSSITLGSGNHTLTFAASNGESWGAGKLLTINGWVGGYDGTAAGGSDPKIFVGSGSSDLSAGQLAQIGFWNGSNTYEADLLATGELVPKISLLPVELVHFEGYKRDDVVDLEWTTASEVNSDFFEVNRCGTDMIFESVGTVGAAGQSFTFETYDFTDFDPLDGINFYKLIQFDLDETEHETKIIEVVSLEKSTLKYVRANPNGDAMFQLSALQESIGTMTVTNINGQTVDQSRIMINEGGNQFVLQTSIWNPGYYIMTIQADGLESQSLKFLVK